MGNTTGLGGLLAIAALTDLEPYVALLTDAPADLVDPTSADIEAVEVTMEGYERLHVDNWKIHTGERPPYADNLFELSGTGALSGDTEIVTHFALVENPSGDTGDIYAVGTLFPAKPLVEDEIIVIPAGKIRITAETN